MKYKKKPIYNPLICGTGISPVITKIDRTGGTPVLPIGEDFVTIHFERRR